MNLFDKIMQATARGEKLPIEGRTKIILTDVETGEQEIIEKKNMVTNAVADIFAKNILGITQFTEANGMLPMWKLFGGVMCFENSLTADADNIWPENETENPMVANAGQTPTAQTTGTRGNPQTPEVDENKIKLIWNWPTTSGNGTISAVALTSSIGGDCSLKPDGTSPMWKTITPEMRNVNVFALSSVGDERDYNRNFAIAAPIEINEDGNGVSLYLNGDQLEEVITSHSFNSAKLLESNIAWPADKYRELSTRTATLSRSFSTPSGYSTQGYAMIAQDEDFYYVMERDSSSNTKLYVNKVSKEDMTVTPLEINISGATLDRVGHQGVRIYSGIVSDGNIYWRSAEDTKTFVRINMTNTADVEILASNMTAAVDFGATPFVINNGLILGHNYLINGSTVYPVAARPYRLADAGREYRYFDMIAKTGSPTVYQSNWSDSSSSYYDTAFGGLVFGNYLATIQNLDSAITKSASRTMRIEYTLTAV